MGLLQVKLLKYFYSFKYFGNVTFSCNEMDILNIDFNKINLKPQK